MKQALINCPSLANSSLLELEEDIRQFWNSGVRWFHIDIMDGHYVAKPLLSGAAGCRPESKIPAGDR